MKKDIIKILSNNKRYYGAIGFEIIQEEHFEKIALEIENYFKNLGEGEAGTGYALLSDGWRMGKNEKPNDREEVLLCEVIPLPNNETTYDYAIGMYRVDIRMVVERHSGDQLNIDYYLWKRLTAPSF